MSNNFTIRVVSEGSAPQPTQVDRATEGATEVATNKVPADATARMVKAQGLGMLKTSISRQFTQMGNYTGNRAAQAQVDNIMTGLNMASSIAAGFAVAGPIGGAVVGAVQIFNAFNQQKDYEREIWEGDAKAQFNRQFQLGSNGGNRNA